MTFDIKFHIKKVIYKNSQLLRDNQTQIKKFFNKKIIHSFIGGGEDLTIMYKDNEYKYTQIMDGDYGPFGPCGALPVIFYILKMNLIVYQLVIDKENKVGEIHGIGNFNSCLIDSAKK
jgi:hypothetical protein